MNSDSSHCWWWATSIVKLPRKKIQSSPPYEPALIWTLFSCFLKVDCITEAATVMHSSCCKPSCRQPGWCNAEHWAKNSDDISLCRAIKITLIILLFFISTLWILRTDILCWPRGLAQGLLVMVPLVPAGRWCNYTIWVWKAYFCFDGQKILFWNWRC